MEINRVNGGCLTVTITGASNTSLKAMTAACGDVDIIEIGMYRGGFLSLANYNEEKGTIRRWAKTPMPVAAN